MPRQLCGLETAVVPLLRQTATLAQAVEQLAVPWSIGEPGRLQIPKSGEGGVVEGEPPVRTEHRNGVGDLAEHRLLRALQSAQLLGRRLRLGDIVRPHPDAATIHGQGAETQSASDTGQAHPTQGGARCSHRDRFTSDAVSLAIQGKAPRLGAVKDFPAPTPASQAWLTQTGAPASSAIQAGSGRASTKAANRSAVAAGAPVGARREIRSRTTPPAVRPSTRRSGP